MLLIASRTVAQGRAAGLATWMGIACGTYCHGIAAALGLSQLFVVLPVAYDLVRYAGAVYLLYLAWTILASQPLLAGNTVATHRPQSFAVVFRQGLITNLLNPKLALFVLALFPQFVDIDAGSVALQMMVFATLINVIGFFVNGAVILMAGGMATSLAHNAGVQKFLNYLLASVFVGLALRLILSDHEA